MAPLAARFGMEMRSRPAVPPVVGFRCDILSPGLAEGEGREKRRKSPSDWSGVRRHACDLMKDYESFVRLSLNTAGEFASSLRKWPII